MIEGLKPENNEASFGDGLEESEISVVHKGSGKFHEVLSNPNKVIRAERFDELKERYENGFDPVELVEIAKNLYGELGDQYGILVPADFLIGKDEKGEKVVYSVVDKIEGKNLDEVEITQEVIVQIETLYSSIAKYLLDKFRAGGFYLTDINNSSQYVYGRKSGELEDKIYLIDTDLYMNNSKVGLYLNAEWFVRHMSEVEKRLGVKFEKAREYMSQFIVETLPEEDIDSEKERAEKHIGEITKFLNNEKLGQSPKSAFLPLSKKI